MLAAVPVQTVFTGDFITCFFVLGFDLINQEGVYKTAETIWDISDYDRESYIKQYGENFFNNTIPILKIYNLTKEYSFEVPSKLVDAEYDGIVKQYEQAKKYNQLDEYEKAKDEKDLLAEYKEIANRRVKLGLLLSEVGLSAKLTITPEDINNAIMTEAKKYPGQEKAVFDYYLKNKEAEFSKLETPLQKQKFQETVQAEMQAKEKAFNDLREKREEEVYQRIHAVAEKIRLEKELETNLEKGLEELESYHYDKLKSEREGINAYVKDFDHYCDGTRYIIMEYSLSGRCPIV